MSKELKLSREYLLREYVQNQRSTYDIAQECNTYPNRVRRALRQHKIKCRNKSAAQSVAIKTGRHKHPTKGNKRPEDIRIKISEGVAKAWESLGEAGKEKRVLLAKQQWEAMSEEQREQFRKLAAEAVRKAAEEGSKLEKFLLIELKIHNYTVLFHKTNMISREELQVDLYLPDLKVAIEVDGPAHFYPIWGEQNLAKHLTADHAKTGLLLAGGYVLIRIKNLAKNVSKIQYRNLLTNLLERLESIKTHFPPPSERLVEIELA
jgi:very-short-patch-repair endonuclease